MINQPQKQQEPPTFTYTTPSTTSFAVPPPIYLSKDPAFQFAHLANTTPTPDLKPFAYLATGALVFKNPKPSQDSQEPPKILLIQRSPTDSWPLHWETPGGGCDSTDPSILSSVARELFEEAGLIATHISGPVGLPHFFISSSGNAICKFSFLVDVESEEVRLDPREHVDFVWAGEEEVRSGRVGEKALVFTTEEQRRVVLEGFEIVKNGVGKGGEEVA